MLFKILPKKELVEIREKSSSRFSEKDLEDLFAPNLEKIFSNLIFVSRQFSIDGLFFDILAFDREQNSPVIFELKKDRAREIVAQGFQYFRLLSTKKEKFIFEFLDKKIIKNHHDEIDWQSSKLIFIAADFSEREIDSASLDLPIELFKFKFFENDNFFLEKVERRKEKPKIGEVLKNPEVEKITREFKEYDRDFHKKRASEKTWELFEKIESELPSWNGISAHFHKFFMDFKLNGRSFLGVNFYKKHLILHFGKEEFHQKFPKKMNITNIRHRKWALHFEYKMSDDKNLDELFFILKQNYKFIVSL